MRELRAAATYFGRSCPSARILCLPKINVKLETSHFSVIGNKCLPECHIELTIKLVDVAIFRTSTVGLDCVGHVGIVTLIFVILLGLSLIEMLLPFTPWFVLVSAATTAHVDLF
jgi:hypothetical protein